MKLDEYKNFLDSWFSEIEKLGIDVSEFTLDHLAYGVSTNSEFDLAKEEFLKFGKLFREVIVSGRRVAVFKLIKPLKYKDFFITAIELIEPKKGEKTKSGFEHAEFTINIPFEDFVNKYPNLSWDTSNINRKDFPRLNLDLNNGLELKFNNLPILLDQ